ncbi:MAG: 6-phosphogluconolactonase [Bdellovibrionota bacterium]|jgi:6-phosphogluconolactonase
MANANAKIETVEPGTFAGVVADEIVASILESVEERGQCSLVLSGGSTPSAVYRLLARPPHEQDIPWDKVHLFIGDDKWDNTNFRMVSETLLVHKRCPEANIHRIDTTVANPQAAAATYTQDIKDFFQLKDGDTPVFDVVLLGVGSDGHIASAFPDSTVVHDRESIACAVEHEGIDRITLTPHVLFNGRRILILVKGRDKAEIVQRVLSGEDTAQELPATLYKGANDRVTWFLCSEAAQLLNGVF